MSFSCVSSIAGLTVNIPTKAMKHNDIVWANSRW